MDIETTDQNFGEYQALNKPMMIDFSAQWCGPCKRMAPIVEDLANKYDGQVIVGKVDVDDSVELSTQFGIRNIPTILFFKNGEVVDKVVGAIPASELESKLQSIV